MSLYHGRKSKWRQGGKHSPGLKSRYAWIAREGHWVRVVNKICHARRRTVWLGEFFETSGHEHLKCKSVWGMVLGMIRLSFLGWFG